ncbi:MAG: hypothetical protein E7261_00195 [Lachnospiraceae bacterium]|nr:hypothetical protein [Lachnospiraceae bacterium]
MNLFEKNYNKKNLLKRILLTFVSVIFMGITLSVLNIINQGMDPCTYMNVSIADKISWSLGNWQLLFNVLMFIPVILWGKKHIGIGTLFNMVLVGYTVDFCMWIWEQTGFDACLELLPVKIVAMLVAVAVFVFAAAIYMSTELGTAPYDALPMMISEKIKKVPFKVIRFIWDATTVVIGFVFSGRVGIVTILMMLFLGQTVAFVRSRMYIKR